MTARHLSRDDTEFFKGVGILLIVLHNYFHWVRPSPGENEFNFSRDRTSRLLDGLWSNPLEAVNFLLDYFGHYGVQIFVFLSAYGLARVYSHGKIRWVPFMLRRVGKIYPVLLLAIAAHLLFVVTPWSEHLAWFLKAYLVKLSLLSGFVPNMQFSLSGPWWFFSFIAQFYAIFPLLSSLEDRRGAAPLFVVGALGLAITTIGNQYLVPNGINLYATVLGHLPVLCLGIYFARAEALVLDRRTVPAAGIVFVLGLWFHPAWLLAPICVAILFLYALPRLAAFLRQWSTASRFVTYCGSISLPLFAIHGMMRQPFTRAANAHNDWLYTLGVAALFVIASLAAARVLSWAENVGRRWIAMIGASQR